MNVVEREVLILVLVFIGLCVFVYTKIASDLPDDFLTKASEHLKKEREARRGRVRDNR